MHECPVANHKCKSRPFPNRYSSSLTIIRAIEIMMNFFLDTSRKNVIDSLYQINER